jgi:hypothetical protein
LANVHVGVTPCGEFFSFLHSLQGALEGNQYILNSTGVAVDVFCFKLSSLIGKLTQKTPILIVNNYIEIPKELITKQTKIVLCTSSSSAYETIQNNFELLKKF